MYAGSEITGGAFGDVGHRGDEDAVLLSMRRDVDGFNRNGLAFNTFLYHYFLL